MIRILGVIAALAALSSPSEAFVIMLGRGEPGPIGSSHYLEHLDPALGTRSIGIERAARMDIAELESLPEAFARTSCLYERTAHFLAGDWMTRTRGATNALQALLESLRKSAPSDYGADLDVLQIEFRRAMLHNREIDRRVRAVRRIEEAALAGCVSR